VDTVRCEITRGVHTHLMARADVGLYADRRLLAAASRAERVALELLTTVPEVRRQVQQRPQPGSSTEGAPQVAGVLPREFGCQNG
jgi:hypothetical protein